MNVNNSPTYPRNNRSYQVVLLCPCVLAGLILRCMLWMKPAGYGIGLWHAATGAGARDSLGTHALTRTSGRLPPCLLGV